PPDRSLRVRVLERDADPRHELAKQHLVVGGTALTAETPELQAADHTSCGCELVRVGRRSHAIAGRRQGDQADPIARAAGEAHAADPELLLEQADHRARQLALVVPVRELTPEPVQRLEPARLLGEQQARHTRTSQALAQLLLAESPLLEIAGQRGGGVAPAEETAQAPLGGRQRSRARTR